MKNKLAFLLLAAVFACTAFTGCSSQSAEAPSIPQNAGESLMALKIEDIDGKEFSLNDTISGNKVTMINVWGTFCGPCLSEMPSLENLYKKYKGDGFAIVGMTCDININGNIDNGAKEDAKDIQKQLDITYPLVVETPQIDSLLPTEYVPATFFFDSNGKQIGEAVVGSQSEEEWEKIIKKLLDEQK